MSIHLRSTKVIVFSGARKILANLFSVPNNTFPPPNIVFMPSIVLELVSDLGIQWWWRNVNCKKFLITGKHKGIPLVWWLVVAFRKYIYKCLTRYWGSMSTQFLVNHIKPLQLKNLMCLELSDNFALFPFFGCVFCTEMCKS